ncbi:MAG: RNA polymerase sigma factor [bacterium]
MLENREKSREIPDSELAILAKTSPEAFAELVGRYEEKLLRYLRRSFSVSGEDGEDILQNAFLKTYQHLNDYDPTMPFSSWVYRIVRNEAIDLFRKRKVVMLPLENDDEDAMSFADILASDIDVEKDVSRNLEREEIMKSMEKLKEKHRAVLILRYLEEKEYGEIADILQIPMGTVATLISRAKKEMKEVVMIADKKENEKL